MDSTLASPWLPRVPSGPWPRLEKEPLSSPLSQGGRKEAALLGKLKGVSGEH